MSAIQLGLLQANRQTRADPGAAPPPSQPSLRKPGNYREQFCRLKRSQGQPLPATSSPTVQGYNRTLSLVAHLAASLCGLGRPASSVHALPAVCATTADFPQPAVHDGPFVATEGEVGLAGGFRASQGGDEQQLSCNILDRPSKKHVCLFYHPEMEELARRVAADSDSIELRSIHWRKFADGFPDLFVPNARTARNRDVAFLASFSSPGVIFEQLSIIYALPRMFVRSFTLVLPFFPTGTQERMEDEGDVATAVTLARILSDIPISRGGPTSVVIFDIHALQERFYFGDSVLPCFESAVPLLKHRLHQLPDSENVTIAFPDEGAWKRFHNQLRHYPTVVCTKVREGERRTVRLKEGDPQGRHVVIVDDLVQSGSTLIECQRLLAARGAHRVSAFATHGVFPQQSWQRFQHDNGDAANGGFAYFWITDSCPSTAAVVRHHRPFEVLSLAGPIQAALQV